jgi:ABC-type Mn2+/Zn2+ transport system ATPase subunit
MPHIDPAISVSNLNIKYPGSDIEALQGISFEIDRGTVSVVIGPNGSGKSTLLQAIMGSIPYSGKIEVNREPGVIGYVPQRFDLDRSLPISVSDFLIIPLKILSYSNLKTNRLIHQTLKHLQISNLKHKLLSQLSGGQFQRVLLARSLIHNPQILLLDEPESGIDPHSEETFYDLLDHINKEHDTTILIASHELSMVSKYADYVICLNHKIVCIGDAKHSISEKVLNELYGYQKRKYQH